MSCFFQPWRHISSLTSELNWSLQTSVSPFSWTSLLSKDEKMSRGQAGPSGSHISWGSACGLHSQKHTRTDSGRILPWPYTPAGLPSGHQRPCCNFCRGQHLDHWTHPQGKRGVCVCLCAKAWGKGVSGEMNQPLSSATRPLTYRACFSKTQRSTLTLSRISLSLFAISCYLPHLSHQRWTRSYFRVIWETEVDALCVCTYMCVWEIECRSLLSHQSTISLPALLTRLNLNNTT